MHSLSTTSITQLPTDLTLSILPYLSPKTRGALPATCSHLLPLGQEQLPAYLQKAHQLLENLSLVTARAAPTPLAQAPVNPNQLKKWAGRIAYVAKMFKKLY